MEKKNYFSELYKIDVTEKIDKKGNSPYLPWAYAWAELKKVYPEATYKVYETKNPAGYKINYFTDGQSAWVKTGVTVNEIEHIEYLPVMDFKNKSIKLEALTSFDVNKAIQRSLTKAVGRHGLGLYIYAGEDLPEKSEEDKIRLEELVESAATTEALKIIWKENAKQGAWFKTLVAQRGEKLKKLENETA